MQQVSIIAQFKKKTPTATYGTIYIRAWLHRKPIAAVSTGQKIRADHWDQPAQRVLSKAPNANLINQVIEIRLQAIKAALLKAEIMGATINPNIIKAAIHGQNDAADFIAFCHEKIKANYTNPGTIKQYNGELTKLQGFRQQVTFSCIDYHFLESYQTYMRQKLKNQPNTVWKTFKFLNTMLNLAIKQGGIIIKNPFQQFHRGTYHQNKRTYLESAEVQQIFAITQLTNVPPVVQQVAAYFCFMCYTGLRFYDCINLNPAKHIVNNQRIVLTTTKGKGNPINIKIYDKLRPVLDYITAHPLKITNQKFNAWLKNIAVLAGINKNLTAHVGRHTFGGFLPDMNIPKDVAQILLGHSDRKSTDIYYHLKDAKIDEAMDRMNNL